MVQAWVFNEAAEGDQRAPHQFFPNVEVSLAELEKLGVFYTKIDIADPNYVEKIDQLALERNYKNRDEITISKEKLPNYEAKIKMFFEEHLHEDEEIRFIKEGSGYFDVRSVDDKWIRISMGPGDLIILPAGIYHRFTLDEGNFIVANRLFKEV
ncbi:1,2-dihydroxy-3-keto-5-methylthiopentene dioxygenase [Nowakowskiella sp. JEL0407]|nr:1,2-dihydroxy-3-keto-5-methylthiopentene dioxygenase [Nowakowskiella sp. JEL0407]